MSKSDEWCTPQVVLDRVCRFWGRIDLDPCSNEHSPVVARQRICRAQGDGDGLVDDWQCVLESEVFYRTRPTVYVNPPYSQLSEWASKTVGFVLSHTHAEVISLVPAYTDTKWWNTLVWTTADAVAYWRGRLKFIDPEGKKDMPARFPSAVVYHGPRATDFARAFGDVARVEVMR